MKCFKYFGGGQAFSLLLLRLVVGAIFIVHGLKKWPVWSSGQDGAMTVIMKILSIAEPLGGLAVILGFLTPVAAAGLALIMVGALYTKISGGRVPFAGGWAYDLLIFASAAALFSFGPGRYGLDHWCNKKFHSNQDGSDGA